MKLKMYFLLLALGALGLQSCNDDDDHLSSVPTELKNAFTEKIQGYFQFHELILSRDIIIKKKRDANKRHLFAIFYITYKLLFWFTEPEILRIDFLDSHRFILLEFPHNLGGLFS